jgi:hypothetical protein
MRHPMKLQIEYGWEVNKNSWVEGTIRYGSGRLTCMIQSEQQDEGTDASSFAELDSIYQDELIVLDVFHEALDDSEISLGVISSSRRIFRNILLARSGHRHHGIPGATDGTYRLAANNWTLIVFGCYGVAYNGPEGFSHRFYPFAYLFVRSETGLRMTNVVLQLPENPGVRDPDYATRGIPYGTGPVTVP